jgi:hypothetical protein
MVRTYLFSGTGFFEHRDIIISTLIVTVAQSGAGNILQRPESGQRNPYCNHSEPGAARMGSSCSGMAVQEHVPPGVLRPRVDP